MTLDPLAPAIDALLAAAVEHSDEGQARALSAHAALEDADETRSEHEAAHQAHLATAEAFAAAASALHTAGRPDDQLRADSATARHNAAAAAHEFARVLVEASADDPHEDGTGMELCAQSTELALKLSKRAAVATDQLREMRRAK